MNSKRSTSRRLARLIAVFLGGYVVASLVRSERPHVNPLHEDVTESESPTPVQLVPQRRRRSLPARLAFAATFVMLFFAGAALTAGAGDQAVQLVEGDQSAAVATTTDAVTTDAAPADAAPAAAPDPAPPVDTTSAPAPPPRVGPPDEPVDLTSTPATPAAPAPDATTTTTVTDEPTDAPVDTTTTATVTDSTVQADAPVAVPATAPVAGSATKQSKPHVKRATKHVVRKLVVHAAAPDPEVDTPGVGSVVWLNRPLGDPTPPADRLTRPFARSLWATARDANTDWALVLGVVRAQGGHGRTPADPASMQLIATRLAELQKSGKNDADAVQALLGDDLLAKHALALAHYDRAVGVETLIQGLAGAKKRLVRRTLKDPQITIYSSGRSDLEANRVDVRVIVAIRYLADTFGSITVSSLVSGHRLYARPRVISAHIYGEAADVAALGGVSIYGHQEPGGVTEQAVEDLLLLPQEVEPKQVISLLGLGGPSFALADHYDHIHVGY
jgi:hypothetical protein